VPPYAEGNATEICRDVQRLRASGAIVVVSLHWGEEFVGQPSRQETQLAHAIIDAGAAVILGHHPHVTRPVERYKSAAIAYSLGNFMGDMVWFRPFREGLVLRCRLQLDGATDIAVTKSHVEDDYLPSLAADSAESLHEGEVEGLEEGAYSRAIARSMRLQRLAAYRFALTNIGRVPPAILRQLVVQTAQNKLAALWRPFRRGRTA
jgi:hypothetical protein